LQTVANRREASQESTLQTQTVVETDDRKVVRRGPGKGAKTVTQRAKDGPFGLTFLNEHIKAGKLRARKAGRLTIITDPDWEQFLESFPLVAAS
jgi:hypothetical protein